MGNLSGLKGWAVLAVVYTALAAGANPVAAQAVPDWLRVGEMRNLVVHPAPLPAGRSAFRSPDGTEHRLADWQGRVVVLNFWATWCAPCRKEMPSLDALAGAMGPEVAVVAVATGRNPVPSLEACLAEAGVTRLPILLDPRQALAREMGVIGLPVTVILDRKGQEVARLIGEADWNAPDAHAVLAAVAVADSR